MRNIALSQQALENLKFWAMNDVRLLRKIFDLMESMLRDPFAGIGKPEALKGDLSGYWSRRINDEHRIVYKVSQDLLIIASCRSSLPQIKLEVTICKLQFFIKGLLLYHSHHPRPMIRMHLSIIHRIGTHRTLLKSSQ